MKFTKKPRSEYSKKSQARASTCSWRAEPILSLELRASKKEIKEFRRNKKERNKKERTEMDMKVKEEEENGFVLVFEDEGCGSA